MSIMIMMFLAVATLPTLVTGQISKTSKPESKAGKLSKSSAYERPSRVSW
jgi:hypothetical protein